VTAEGRDLSFFVERTPLRVGSSFVCATGLRTRALACRISARSDFVFARSQSAHKSQRFSGVEAPPSVSGIR
jgi:hypothetical protein